MPEDVLLKVNGVELATEVLGDRSAPAIVLIHGAGNSLLVWEDEFVARLVDGGRCVVRFDSRDAGRSTGYPVGAPPYDLRDLVADVAALVAEVGSDRAHLVGMSQGAAIGQLMALDHPERVASLTLMAATPGGPGHSNPDLPAMSAALRSVFAGEPEEPDWSDRTAVVDYLVDAERPFVASSRPFDEDGMRSMAERVFDRTTAIAAMLTNPFLMEAGDPWRHRLGQISVPTLVLHGTEDPLFPVAHGHALAAEIPGASIIELERTGHEVFPREQWDTVIPALLDHTSGS
jgi:pimeloyl-ACP methyl ester carboxylesterase